MYIRWNRRQLLSNYQRGEFLCPHVRVYKPWIVCPVLVHRWKDTRKIKTIWNPGPYIRECCIREGRGLAIAAWWWEVKNRFEDLAREGLSPDVPDTENTTQALLEQLEDVEAMLEEMVPRPTVRDWNGYLEYREDMGFEKRRVLRRPPPCVKILGLPWPFTKDELAKRWKILLLKQHPDHGGDTEIFRKTILAYKTARSILIPKDRVENLAKLIKERFPGANLHVDEPAHPTGYWFVDIKVGSQDITFEYRPEGKFGLFSADTVYSEGPSEIFSNEEDLLNRIHSLTNDAGLGDQPR